MKQKPPAANSAIQFWLNSHRCGTKSKDIWQDEADVFFLLSSNLMKRPKQTIKYCLCIQIFIYRISLCQGAPVLPKSY